ncbi:MAG: hypothetical protein ACK53A_03440 [Gemmatimonadota bacterium]|jgi:hypothetical protein|nr:hypothetical protein [Gemmatimonadota bacterium]
MFRFLFTIAIGVGAGYYLGWTDHTKHEKHVLERLTERAGGAVRRKVQIDPDSLAAAVEDSATAWRRR